MRFSFRRGRLIAAIAGGTLGFAALATVAGFFLGDAFGSGQRMAESQIERLQTTLNLQAQEVAQLKESNARELNAFALHMGALQARSARLEAFGTRLSQLGNLEDGEFDFSSAPAFGGPEEPLHSSEIARIDLQGELLSLESRLDSQFVQLGLIEELVSGRELESAMQPAGRPVAKGWLSSGYGKRTDPFTAKPAMHYGIDFSGQPGSDVLAVADGVVIWSGKRAGYGNVVDIDHGNGYVTRYAHNKENSVSVGDRVRAGETIALMGSSGRATSSHVHFEVWLDGRRINPTQLISDIRS